jgi:hypothetical protein
MKAHHVKIPSKRVIEVATQLKDDTVLFRAYIFSIFSVAIFLF